MISHDDDLACGTKPPPIDEFIGSAKPASPTLRDLAARLTPNPALTIDGTLQIILSGIDNIDDEDLARALARANKAFAIGGDPGELSDEEWRGGDIKAKLMLIRAAKALKEALRMMAQ